MEDKTKFLPANTVLIFWLTCIISDPSVSGVTANKLRLCLESENIE